MNRRWFWFAAAVAIGIALGLLYGWVINPVQYEDTTPETLRRDYQADYVLMVAEAYQAENDLQAASTRLSILNREPQAAVEEALVFARSNQYSEADLAALSALAHALDASPTPAPRP